MVDPQAHLALTNLVGLPTEALNRFFAAEATGECDPAGAKLATIREISVEVDQDTTGGQNAWVAEQLTMIGGGPDS